MRHRTLRADLHQIKVADRAALMTPLYIYTTLPVQSNIPSPHVFFPQLVGRLAGEHSPLAFPAAYSQWRGEVEGQCSESAAAGFRGQPNRGGGQTAARGPLQQVHEVVRRARVSGGEGAHGGTNRVAAGARPQRVHGGPRPQAAGAREQGGLASSTAIAPTSSVKGFAML